MPAPSVRRILYVGQLRYGGTCRDRMEVLSSFGFDIIAFNVDPLVAAANRIVQSLAGRLQRGPLIRAFNARLLELARASDYDAVWIDKGVWVLPSTLSELRERASARIAIHFTPDAQFFSQRSRFLFQGIPLYDICATTKPFEVSSYAASGARQTILVLQGYSRFFDPALASRPQAAKSAGEVIFVGHTQPHYIRSLHALAKSGIDVAIHGGGWQRHARRHPWLGGYIRSDGIWGSEYAAALAASTIGIGLLGKHIPETTTTRSFEIPASGTFLLAERTDDHMALFEEDSEAVFWSSQEELVDKARFYLDHKDLRDRIAMAGRRRCVEAGYDSATQIARILAALEIRLPSAPAESPPVA
ncbi:CgeB family protein [Rhizorhabdus dicambivorans]|uniref:Glycosyltransferase family 1 protein n=1 Tax=Rhizorhabdus dicambivorans TaxID=1850238 RepID=A0A2A4FPV2_9SPHN|nr:glycosyltransferase [Rhizorhabdus dicambivorans]ATE66183.1 glycosyltransferase family 1 protein [Rhizorhabdus dicambivorans]PCE39744.1 glycosyltransferase family 1 protein [Rhizorhabdus dicambivorans]